jgi:hypothetical protein
MIKRSKFFNLTTLEVNSITNMFKLYDYKSTGRIPNYLAVKLIESLGLPARHLDLDVEVALAEVLSIVDKLIPEPEPILASSMTSFSALATVTDEDGKRFITPQAISEFMQSLGRPTTSETEAALMLNSMLEYDDCSKVASVSIDSFNKELTTYAKKQNAFKDYRP